MKVSAKFNQTGMSYSAPVGYTIGLPRLISISTSGTTTLASVVLDQCVRAGLDPEHVDVSQLEGDTVDGYVIAKQDSVRNCIGPLCQAYYMDAVESSVPNDGV